jgi:hypothetical protein
MTSAMPKSDFALIITFDKTFLWVRNQLILNRNGYLSITDDLSKIADERWLREFHSK